MRVLHVVPYLPKASGVTTFVVECSDALQRSGVDQEVFVKDQVRLDVANSLADVPRIGSEAALSRIMDFDIVHFHGIWPPFMHQFAAEAVRHDIPTVWSLHGMLSPWAMRYKWWKKLFPWILWQRRDLRAASVLHVTSDHESEWVKGLGFLNQIVNIPLGTHVPAMVPDRNHDQRALLFVGRLNPIKGLENLVRAWKEAQEDGWRLRIVGTDEAGYSEVLKALIGELKLESCVDLPGPKYGNELEREYQGADALILPSFTENFGGVVIDALGWALPVITSMGTPWREVEDERCGWCVPNDAGSLAKAIKSLIALSDSDRKLMGMRGRELVLRKYSWTAVASQMITLYEGLRPHR